MFRGYKVYYVNHHSLAQSMLTEGMIILYWIPTGEIENCSLHFQVSYKHSSAEANGNVINFAGITIENFDQMWVIWLVSCLAMSNLMEVQEEKSGGHQYRYILRALWMSVESVVQINRFRHSQQ